MSEITELLRRAGDGDEQALDAVFQSLYPELRRLAQARVAREGGSLSPTVLVHEVYLRLVGNDGLSINDRAHFFACAAKAMRHIAIDELRRDLAVKRGGGAAAVTLDDSLSELALPGNSALLEVSQAMDTLGEVNARQKQVVELRFFAGLEFQEIAELLGCSLRTTKREWERARAFLYAQLA
ncbi:MULTISPECIES: ECF-type sigma factor [Arenimonas]|uniref:DNA-directed RNA polymerase sigma-70 factor n=1 Tax=Arenimonas soli TaxID=2269504 RepID=A0ABQ1HNL0_9GAMM|nr:ECF-type sigma factor [Arenimonas soli]GGA83361.1 DNA-directed RNA polymerase sigma-70 factor [Arenimonas soli]